MTTEESAGIIALAADEDVLVFVSTFVGIWPLSLIIFLLVGVEHAMIMEPINKIPINNFPMTLTFVTTK